MSNLYFVTTRVDSEIEYFTSKLEEYGHKVRMANSNSRSFSSVVNNVEWCNCLIIDENAQHIHELRSSLDFGYACGFHKKIILVENNILDLYYSDNVNVVENLAMCYNKLCPPCKSKWTQLNILDLFKR